MSYTNSRKDLLMESLQSFFKKSENIITIIPILTNNRKISLRIIDWFVTNYAKKNNISYLINKQNNKIVDLEDEYDPLHCKEFVVYLNYKLQLKAYAKSQFDPFCRKSRINFHYDRDKLLNYIKSNNLNVPNIESYIKNNDDNFFVTTSGQLNFFRWIIKYKIIDYIMDNLKDIEKDMNTCYKKHYDKSKKNKNKRKKRHELSVSASKSLSKSNVKVILTFN